MGETEAITPRVCIIGAGISGLCACRHLLKRGIEPVVLELNSEIGGVWRSNSVSITKLQTPSIAYQFSDFPWPENTPELATGSQVLDYLQAYAQHFQLLRCIRFDSKVLEINEKSGGSCWEVLVEMHQAQTSSTQQVLEFDFIILCIGRFGDIPRLPSFDAGKGPEVFKGQVMHSIDYAALKNAPELLAGNKVVVVGYSKSALDIVAEAAEANQGIHGGNCTLLFRRPHWTVPDWNIFGINIGFLFGTRFFETLVSNKPDQGRLSSMFSSLLFPLRWFLSRVMEVHLRWRLPLSRYKLIPSVSFYEQLSSCKVSLLPDKFFDNVDEGRIRLCKASEWHFNPSGIQLGDGEQIDADVVVLCTGFQGEVKLRSILPTNYAKVLQGPEGVVPLYRGIIHPGIPRMGILGYQEDLSNVRASEIGARWLACLLRGEFELPDPKVMEESANSWVKFMKRSTPYYDRACVSTIRIWHSDELCRDIGWNPYRKKNWFQELFLPYSNLDYQD